jgi:bifunctional non-homologous end joining protein LigD
MLVEIDGHRIEFQRPEKWVWYGEGHTMLDLAEYYVAVSPWLLPYLKRRPVVYEIYPGTIDGPHSFEQDPPAGTPRWLKRVKIQGREREVTYVVADSAAALVYLVSLFMVAVHVWQSTTAAIEKPDFLLLDLDPVGECPLSKMGRAALAARDLLFELGIGQVLVKTSGARGLHVVVPLVPEYDFKAVRAFADRIARELAARHPQLITARQNVKDRPEGTVYLDARQIGRGMTIVPPFSARACDGAPVSMPLAWEEVERYARSRSKRSPMEQFKRYNISSVVAMLKDAGDPWESRRPERLSRLISSWPASDRSRPAAS